ncbi:unnamed protein product, partial [Nesidiocoris tenuis]
MIIFRNRCRAASSRKIKRSSSKSAWTRQAVISTKAMANRSPRTSTRISHLPKGHIRLEEDEAKVVRVQFQRAESDRAKKAREASYTHYMEKTGVEPWYNTQYHNVDSAIAK